MGQASTNLFSRLVLVREVLGVDQVRVRVVSFARVSEEDVLDEAGQDHASRCAALAHLGRSESTNLGQSWFTAYIGSCRHFGPDHSAPITMNYTRHKQCVRWQHFSPIQDSLLIFFLRIKTLEAVSRNGAATYKQTML